MKVLYVLSSTNRYGGATKAFLQLLDGLIQLGVEPFFILPDIRDFYLDLKNRDVKVKALLYRMAVYPPYKGLKNECKVKSIK